MNILAYITTKDLTEARAIAHALISEKLAACCNIIPNIISIYQFHNAIKDEQETLLIAKTTRNKFQTLIKKVKSIHSYDCPSILSIDISDGNQDFLSFMRQQLAE
jgi:periplasmic divalent cation tolerance protein